MPVILTATDQLLNDLLQLAVILVQELLVQLSLTETHLDQLIHQRAEFGSGDFTLYWCPGVLWRCPVFVWWRPLSVFGLPVRLGWCVLQGIITQNVDRFTRVLM